MADKETGPKYGVDDLVKDTGLQKPSIRIGLRESDFTKKGAVWGWDSKKDYEEVLKFFKERSARRPATEKKAAPKVEAKPTRKAKETPAAEAPAKPTRRKAAA